MPTFRGLATYADGTPGATDRLLFETSGGAPRGIAPASLLSGASGLPWTGQGTLTPSAISFATNGIYSPLAISANTTFGVAASPVSGASVAVQITISGSPILTWSLPLVAEDDLQNTSLPALLEPGTYLLRAQYFADLGGSGQHRAVVRIS